MHEDTMMEPAAKADLLSERARALNLIIVVAVAAIVLLAGSSSYSAWVSSTSHKTNCGRIDKLADAVQGIVVLAFTPQPGKTVTGDQFKAIQKFEAGSSALLAEARC